MEKRKNHISVKRKPFQGVLNILDFNRHFYYYGLLTLGVVLFIIWLFEIKSIWWWIASGLFAYGLLMPLIISAYVYDFSGYYKLEWLKKTLKEKKNKSNLVNINAGFDETSYLIKDVYPESNIQVFDFYNKQEHTEEAIVRARNVSLVYPNTKQISTEQIPLKDNSVDVVFLLSAAHEIRDNNEKVVFLKECKRVLKKEGDLIIVEHLRDLPNFLAFSIGFTHFFSSKTWIRSLNLSGFDKVSEQKFTAFMSVFKAS